MNNFGRFGTDDSEQFILMCQFTSYRCIMHLSPIFTQDELNDESKDAFEEIDQSCSDVI